MKGWPHGSRVSMMQVTQFPIEETHRPAAFMEFQQGNVVACQGVGFEHPVMLLVRRILFEMTFGRELHPDAPSPSPDT